MNLFVGNLSPETSEGKLREMFSEFGEVVSVKILIDPNTGMPRGFGFVEMADKFHAFDAIDNLDATYLQGTIISVKEARQNTGGPGGNNRGGGGAGGNRPRSFTPRQRTAPNPNRNFNSNGEGYNKRFNQD